MSVLDFYAVVRIGSTDETWGLGVAGMTGVVLGRSEGPSGRTYAVLVEDETYVVRESDLVPTGEIVERAAIYGGNSVRVPAKRYIAKAEDHRNK